MSWIQPNNDPYPDVSFAGSGYTTLAETTGKPWKSLGNALGGMCEKMRSRPQAWSGSLFAWRVMSTFPRCLRQVKGKVICCVCMASYDDHGPVSEGKRGVLKDDFCV
jgi:hypothetical protein